MVSVAEPTRRLERCGGSGETAILDASRANLGVLAKAKGDDPARESLQARHHARVVGVEDGPRRRAGLVEDLGLGICDRIRGREESDVRVSDIGPHADVRLGNFDEPSDFSRVIHAQLHHRDVRPRRQLEQRERQADVVVQVPGVAIHRVSRREERRRCFLRRRLARASRNRDDVGARLAPHVVAEPLQPEQRVLHLDHHRAGAIADLRPRRHHHADGAGLEARGRVRRAVEPLTAQRDEELPRRDLSRVGRERSDLAAGTASPQAAAAGLRHFRRRQHQRPRRARHLNSPVTSIAGGPAPRPTPPRRRTGAHGRR